ncbi:hypothetical protein like AT4G38120 [Hibiscus trionum]|uniref:Uncharacterized protein n=1 Tax=Hibiscus trionum TaxID=183268 RepID=A0A9W7I002_HIBTR|nr:hypothetical protein like AT4G38120 [Hibiscus trionum]GMI85718.1 hypothetical protein like AT4G38120 [Hibiscus trionum]
MHMNVISLYSSSGNQRSANEMGKKLPRNGSLWEVQTTSFTMLGELYSRTGSSFPLDIWQSTIQFLREGATEVATKSWKEQDGNTAVFAGGKIVRAAIKVLDECLRAISGFRGTEDFFLDFPFTSDCISPESGRY